MINFPHLFSDFLVNENINENICNIDSCPIEINVAHEYCDITLYELIERHGSIQEVINSLQFDLQKQLVKMVNELININININIKNINTKCVVINLFPYSVKKKVKFVKFDLLL